MLLALAPAKAQTVVYQGETTTLEVEQMPGDSYKWELYKDSTVNFATDKPDCPPEMAYFVGVNEGSSVQVKWIEPGRYFFKVTAFDITGCTSNIKIGIMEVKEAKPTATITSPDQNICDGEAATIEVTLTGKGPWDLIYSDDAGNLKTITGITGSAYQLIVKPNSSTRYFITEVKDMNATNKIVAPYFKVWVFVSDRPVFSKTIHPVEP